MKVLMFGWEFPPYISGGLGTACHGLTKHLSQKGIAVTFVLPKIKGELKSDSIRIIGGQSFSYTEYERLKRENQSYQKLIQVSSTLRPYLNEQTYQEHLRSIKEQQEEVRPLRTVGQSLDFSGDYGNDLLGEVGRYALLGGYLGMVEEFDVIHAHDWMTYLAGIEAKKSSGKPLVVHIHATEFDRCGENGNPDIISMERQGFEAADRIVAVSYRTRDMVIEKYGIAPSKVEVVHNGVEMESVYNNPAEKDRFLGDKIVLFLGRITMQKGPDYFIEAAAKVLKKMSNVRFLMAGSGDMTLRMIERMAQLRICDRFHFTGFLDKEERERVFSMSDLYIMPSVSEPFGITPLEAMRYNIPVIISKQSGVGEILHNVIKVDFWDTEMLASSIVNVLENSQLKHHLTKDSYELLEKMNWGVAAEKVIDVYKKSLFHY